jgi:hypothetical protein
MIKKLEDTFDHSINGGAYPSEVKLKINEIIDYLNEQYEQNKPCKHEYLYELSGDCQDCGKNIIKSL